METLLEAIKVLFVSPDLPLIELGPDLEAKFALVLLN
jgi:hypothetical protein